MTSEEIKAKAKEIANRRTDVFGVDYFSEFTTEDLFDAAMEIANWIVERMTVQEKPVTISSSACITDDDKLIIATDLSVLKRYETLKNGIKNNSDRALVQQAVDKARDLSNTIEGALAGEEPFPATYYRMCQEVIGLLTRVKGVV